MSSSPLKPIYAFADSRLLFWKQTDGSLFLNSVSQISGTERPSAAYIGASNGDTPEFYHEIFEPAMRQIGAEECRMILSRPAPEDNAFLDRADIILLAGGSVEAGWRLFEKNGFKQLISRRFCEGAVLIGVSAGAVQLGRGGLTDDGSALLSTFNLLPFYVGAHDEKNGWASLRKALALAPAESRGIGISYGGGIIYHAGELEPVGKPAFELSIENDQIRESMLLPNTG